MIHVHKTYVNTLKNTDTRVLQNCSCLEYVKCHITCSHVCMGKLHIVTPKISDIVEITEKACTSQIQTFCPNNRPNKWVVKFWNEISLLALITDSIVSTNAAYTLHTATGDQQQWTYQMTRESTPFRTVSDCIHSHITCKERLRLSWSWLPPVQLHNGRIRRAVFAQVLMAH